MTTTEPISQSRRMSAIEQVTNTAVGYCLAVAMQLVFFPLFDMHPHIAENLSLAAIFTFASLLRGYIVRRVFNQISSKQVEKPRRPILPPWLTFFVLTPVLGALLLSGIAWAIKYLIVEVKW